MSVALLESDVINVIQLAFWPPDREVNAPPKRRALIQAIFAAQIEVVVPTGVFACTYPGCSRGPQHPFESGAQLANHRFAAHGIRSTNEESIKRQQRRDRARAAVKGEAPEYIDAAKIRADIQKRFPINLPADTKSGALDPGDREYVRKRLCHLVTTELQRILHREPAEIAIVAAQVIAAGLAPVGLNARVLDPRDALSTAPPSSKRGKK